MWNRRTDRILPNINKSINAGNLSQDYLFSAYINWYSLTLCFGEKFILNFLNQFSYLHNVENIYILELANMYIRLCLEMAKLVLDADYQSQF